MKKPDPRQAQAGLSWLNDIGLACLRVADVTLGG